MLDYLLESLFGKKASPEEVAEIATTQSPKETAEVAEAASDSIEQRMRRVKQALENGGYRGLTSDTLRQLHEDLDKILAFVDEAITILSKAQKLEGLDASLRRLRNVKTRVETEMRKRLTELGGSE
jgi:hypothetical protein